MVAIFVSDRDSPDSAQSVGMCINIAHVTACKREAGAYDDSQFMYVAEALHAPRSFQ
jgi:hypothetical protein